MTEKWNLKWYHGLSAVPPFFIVNKFSRLWCALTNHDWKKKPGGVQVCDRCGNATFI